MRDGKREFEKCREWNLENVVVVEKREASDVFPRGSRNVNAAAVTVMSQLFGENSQVGVFLIIETSMI